MILSKVMERFVAEAPIGVMVRATLENVLSAEKLDQLFERHARKQYVGELLFSTVADIMGQVVCQIQPSVNAVYVKHKEELGVTIKSVYDKLQRVETCVSRALVRETAQQMQAIIQQTGGLPEPLVPGYRVKIVDGNHLRRTQRRIGELRKLNAAPLPGKALVVLDPQARLVIDVLPCEDGHAQERKLFAELLETAQPKDLWIADRNFCTVAFLTELDRRQAKFIVRQHGNLPVRLCGKRRRYVGETETGIVYEQLVEITGEDGEIHKFRRITVVLHEETRDGDSELHLITNLPKRIIATRVAKLYRERWRIETAFQELAANLNGEIETLGYPKAALFGFCMALVTYNLFSVVRAAVHAVHGEEAAENLSVYYAALEVSSIAHGMTILLDAEYWEKKYSQRTPRQMASELKRMAGNIQLDRYRKGKWTPKKKTASAMNKRRRGHVSTAQILERSRQRRAATN